MSPADDFSDKCDRIMKELVQPVRAPDPIRVWMTPELHARLMVVGMTTTISNADIEIIRSVNFVPTRLKVTTMIIDEMYEPVTDTKSKNPMASQQAWKKKHRR